MCTLSRSACTFVCRWYQICSCFYTCKPLINQAHSHVFNGKINLFNIYLCHISHGALFLWNTTLWVVLFFWEESFALSALRCSQLHSPLVAQHSTQLNIVPHISLLMSRPRCPLLLVLLSLLVARGHHPFPAVLSLSLSITQWDGNSSVFFQPQSNNSTKTSQLLHTAVN